MIYSIKSRSAYVIYNILLAILIPVFMVVLVVRLCRDQAYRSGFWQRFAIGIKPCKQPCLHFHAVSLGESKSIAPLIRQVMISRPELRIVFTCTTATGADFINKTFGDTVAQYYLPFDFWPCSHRFTAQIAPEAAIITEVEWWPNLLRSYKTRGIPVIYANARMTDRSFRRYSHFSTLFSYIGQAVSRVCTQSQRDTRNLLQLGIPEEKLYQTGNLKFDNALSQRVDFLCKKPKNRIVWVAASTHDEDEREIIQTLCRLHTKFPEVLLIIAPRHPDRFDKVYNSFERHGFTVGRFTTSADITPQMQVFLLDCMGELTKYLSLADFCFVGGSMSDVGGHDPIEPASYGVPIIMGPSIRNCRFAVEQLAEAGGLVSVNDSAEMLSTLLHWISSPMVAQSCAKAAKQVVEGNQGALEITKQAITSVLAEKNQSCPEVFGVNQHNGEVVS